MGYNLKIKNGSKLTIDPGKQIILKWVFERPDVLSLYESTESFTEFVPHLAYNVGNDKKVRLTEASLNELKTLVNQSLILKNCKDGEFSTTFSDKRVFQVGIIITKPHRHKSRYDRKGNKRPEILAAWEENNTCPKGAAIAWQGTPIKQVNPTTPKITRINFDIDWDTGEIIGFDQVLDINNIKPGKKNEQRPGPHEVYFFGLIFRIRNPYTNEYIKTQPSDASIYRSINSIIFPYPSYHLLPS